MQQQRSPERDNHVFSKTLQLQEPKILAEPNKGQAVFACQDGKDSCKGWKLMAFHTRWKALDPPAGLQLLKRFSSLIAGKGLGATSSEAPELAESEHCSSN